MAEDNQNYNEEVQKSYTEDELQAHVNAAMRKQLMTDELRIHGNAFYAEALDHIESMGKKDPFWAKVFQYGLSLKDDFEVRTGQRLREPTKLPEKKSTEVPSDPSPSTQS